MKFTAATLHYVFSILNILLLTASLSQAESSPNHSSSWFGGNASAFCKLPDLSTSYSKLCMKYPEMFVVLVTSAMQCFRHHCRHQFKHERWNCENINFPLLGMKQPAFLTLETKEAAFVYALASATVVHNVAQKCAHNSNMLGYCGCDSTLSDEALESGETWGCSPDIDFGINFTQQLLDITVGNTTSDRHKTFILHNSKIGQSIVKENMNKTCECVAKECVQSEKCVLMLPTMREVAKELKAKYEQSVCKAVTSTQEQKIDVDGEDDAKGELIHFNCSVDYCIPNSDYNIAGIAGRECTPDSKHTSSSYHCNNLCCGYGEKAVKVTISQLCNCTFVWCCEVKCDTCFEEKTKHICKSKN